MSYAQPNYVQMLYAAPSLGVSPSDVIAKASASGSGSVPSVLLKIAGASVACAGVGYMIKGEKGAIYGAFVPVGILVGVTAIAAIALGG